MIAKRIPRPKTASNFARLGAYILGNGHGEGAADDSPTFHYILNEVEGGGRVGDVRISNCLMDNPGDAIKEILVTQGRNKRSRGDRTYHLVVSFEPGEQPTAAQIEDIENELCAAIGLERHQRISAVHTDKAHLHLHIAINKVDPVSLRCTEPYYDKRKLMAACAALELKHGLAKTNHGLSKRARPKGKPADLEAHTAEASFLSWVKARIEPALLAAIAQKPGWNGIHSIFAREGLVLKRRGAGLIIADTKNQIAVRASAVNRAFSIKALEDRLGPFQPPSPAPQSGQSSYGRAPLQKSNTATLYADYVRQRTEGLQAKRAVREAAALTRNAIFARFRKRQQDLRRTGLTRSGKRARRGELRLIRAGELAASTSKKRQDNETIDGAYFFTWISYLQARAKQGDTGALQALRASPQAAAKAAAAFLTAQDETAAKTIILKELNPIVRRGGELSYTLSDGGAITDERCRIRIDKASYQATLVALTLGAERFRGQTLTIAGTGAFKREAVEVAAALNLKISFTDPVMEDERRQMVLKKSGRLSSAEPRGSHYRSK